MNDKDVLLPDSRMEHPVGVIRMVRQNVIMNWVPVYCANCGKPYGYVPEENCSFACWLCDPCADKWGTQFSQLMMPDEVFWKKVEQEQLDRYGRILSEEEFKKALEAKTNPLTKLLKEGV